MVNFPRQVGLFLPLTSGYFTDVVIGVQEYVRNSPGWIIEACPTVVIADGTTQTWKPDGILVNCSDGDWVGLVNRLGVPVIQIGGNQVPGMARVTTDNEAIGALAAEHFLERGFRRFAFCGYRDIDWSRQREAGYRQRIEASGATCESLLGGEGQIFAGSVTTLLADWVRALPKPVAVFACHDRCAMLVSNACSYLRIRVPEDVAILGVDNSMLECGFSSPPISSIMGSARRVGYEAAALLDRLMDGEQPPKDSVGVPPAEVAVRQSTDVLAIRDPDVAAALRFILRNASNDIDVSDVVESLLVSRRLLERKFKLVLNRTPREEILRAHIAHAKGLLVSTDMPTMEIALGSGFPSASKFSAVFKRETGLSPSTFRRLYGTYVGQSAKTANRTARGTGV